MPFGPGKQVGRYKVVRMIAQGGMAEVYRAEQELAAGIFRPAALKVIRPEYSGSNDFREMFLDEARTACTLSHPNIVHIYEVGELDGLLYMAMELVPGETLAAVARSLRENGERFSDESLLAVGIYTCSALEAVHALKLPGEGHLNLVHRDVSPHNLLLSATGSLKLIDFGIAKAATNRNLTSPGVTKGKAGYFSPEQAMARPLDGRSDLFSLGITLYKLACGATPFDDHKTHQSRNNALVTGRWKPLEKVCPGLPQGFYAAIDRVLQIRPEDRFLDARQMREALERVAIESGVHVGQSSLTGYVDDGGEISASASQKMRVLRRTERVMSHVTAEPERVRRTRRLLIGIPAGAVMLIAVVAGLILLLRSPEPAASPAVDARDRREEPAAVKPPQRVPEVEVSVHPVQIVERPQEARVVSSERRVKPPPEEKIPRGEGRLRIGAVPDGVVTVGKDNWGSTPIDRKISSGRYLVNIVGSNGQRGLCQATVMPDRTTILIYSFDSGSCRKNE